MSYCDAWIIPVASYPSESIDIAVDNGSWFCTDSRLLSLVVLIKDFDFLESHERISTFLNDVEIASGTNTIVDAIRKLLADALSVG